MAEPMESSLTPQEQEMLAYLEDLQQNNPAEYEMLVQQEQAALCSFSHRHAMLASELTLASTTGASCSSPTDPALRFAVAGPSKRHRG